VVSEPSAAIPPPAASVQPKQGLQDTYQLLFPTLGNLAYQNDYRQIIEVAERGDLKGDSDRQFTRLLLVAPLTLAYLILDELPPARYALTRLPEKLAAHPLSQALFGLLAATSERQYEHIYSRAESLFHYAQQPDFLDPKLGDVVALMTKAFVASFQERTITLLSRAFTSLPVSLAQTYLELSADQLLAAAEKHGWSYDASNQTLSPAPLPSNTVTPVYAYGPSSLNTFNLVADSTAKLEM
jgi:COP9 signalosome complex subunit 8